MIKVMYADISKLSVNKNNLITLPKLRKEYVNSIKDKNRNKQSVFVWKLLEYALKGLGDFKFQATNIGKWFETNNKIYFSLTHSENVVAVAISDIDVGIDVEMCSEKILRLKGKNKNINEIDDLTLEWTKKESQYKRQEKGVFDFKKISDADGNFYFLTVCTNCNDIEFLEVDHTKLDF